MPNTADETTAPATQPQEEAKARKRKAGGRNLLEERRDDHREEDEEHDADGGVGELADDVLALGVDEDVVGDAHRVHHGERRRDGPEVGARGQAKAPGSERPAGDPHREEPGRRDLPDVHQQRDGDEGDGRDGGDLGVRSVGRYGAERRRVQEHLGAEPHGQPRQAVPPAPRRAAAQWPSRLRPEKIVPARSAGAVSRGVHGRRVAGGRRRRAGRCRRRPGSRPGRVASRSMPGAAGGGTGLWERASSGARGPVTSSVTPDGPGLASRFESGRAPWAPLRSEAYPDSGSVSPARRCAARRRRGCALSGSPVPPARGAPSGPRLLYSAAVVGAVRGPRRGAVRTRVDPRGTPLLSLRASF